jgi:hypothetical protein
MREIYISLCFVPNLPSKNLTFLPSLTHSLFAHVLFHLFHIDDDDDGGVVVRYVPVSINIRHNMNSEHKCTRKELLCTRAAAEENEKEEELAKSSQRVLVKWHWFRT